LDYQNCECVTDCWEYSCYPGTYWDQRACECVCDLMCLEADGLRPDFETCECVPLTPAECGDVQCPHGSQLNEYTCDCVQHDECHDLYCPSTSGLRPDFEKCECVQMEAECEIKHCPPGSHLKENWCTCVDDDFVCKQ